MAKWILAKLDVKRLLETSHTFVIADLGCSVGPNTFFVVQNIVETVIEKCSGCGIDIEGLEFQAFLNDKITNDFNTLFSGYHKSQARSWMTSAAWNRGRIYIVDAPKDVTEAYRQQYTKDMEVFLDARAAELVSGGLMALFLPMAPTSSNCTFYGMVLLLESVFRELVAVDSFNIQYYSPTSAELKAVVARDGRFVIEKIERFERPKLERSQRIIDAIVMHLRAGWEGIIKAHFGDDVIEPLFERFKERVDQSSLLSDSGFVPLMEMLFLLKCL
ncbi:hypothetical protein MLD38_001566 [Melastoma candidum]|uniref:Uncharacterized protein n=1 Tax=Melastoma candidum TaxID=119954 RepID=A0ACB9SGZ0_9MYRT|nr:hypothetical protein MLD38_001566 [Melastoma candidum]